MKRYIIAALALVALAGCEKEKALTPSEVRNWLEITDPGSGGDAVDKKIYDIYKAYGISVFLTDTIGREDRGWRNAKGDVEYYYEMVDLNYDLTALPPGTDGKVGWTRIEHWLPAQKARVLPLLELFEQKLIPAVGGAEEMPRIVMITDGLDRGGNVQGVLRGASYIAMPVSVLEAEQGDFIWSFVTAISPELADPASPVFEEYYDVARQAFIAYSPNIWADTAPHYGQTNWFSGWDQVMRAISWFDFTAEQTRLQELIAGGDNSAATAQQLAHIEGRLATLNFSAAEQSTALAYEATYRTLYEDNRSEHFGMGTYDQRGELKHWYLNQSVADMAFFVGLLLNNDYSELTALYGRFPVMMQRFNLLKTALTEAGIDLDSLRG